MSTVIDYAWGRPSMAALRAAGAVAVCRYLAYPWTDAAGKILTPVETAVLTTAGFGIVSNWEQAGSWAEYGQGFREGAAHATEAARQHTYCGGPAGRPIYFSVDFDATAGQLPAIGDYYRGVASVIGLDRTGAYGGFRVIKYLLDQGLIRWAWQTYAWSTFRDSPDQAPYLHWDPRAQLRQVDNGVFVDGVDCDLNESMTADFGQWGTGVIDMSQPFAADNADAYGWALTQRLKDVQVHANGTDPGLTTVPNKVEPLLVKLEHFLDNPPAPVPVALTAEDRAAIVAGVAAHLDAGFAALRGELAAAVKAALDVFTPPPPA